MRVVSTNKRFRQRFIWIGFIFVLILLALILVWVNRSTRNSPLPHQTDLGRIEEKVPTPITIEDEGGDPDKSLVEYTAPNTESSVWEICGLHDFPLDQQSAAAFIEDLVLSKECEDALASLVLSTNPFTMFQKSKYPWSQSARGYTGNEFSLVVLDNPMTYERVFSDPVGDFERIMDALSREECRRVNQSEVNSEIADSCHADAFTNFAVFFNDCHQRSAEKHFARWQHSLKKATWQDYLANRWVDSKREEFDSVFELSTDSLQEQWESLLKRLGNHSNPDSVRIRSRLVSNSIYPGDFLMIGASLGDEAASLTYQGLHVGPFVRFLAMGPWQDLSQKKALSKDRLYQAFHFVLFLEDMEVDIDLDWFVKHLCTTDDSKTGGKQKSCGSLIYDFYTNENISGPELEVLNKIEKIAIKLDVYE